MAQYNYAFQKFNPELMARAVARDIEVSPKQAIEICNFLRGRKLSSAKALIEKVIEVKLPVPFKRFTNGLGHRKGKMASGRYPVKASKVFLKLMSSVEANAQTKGLNTGELTIIHLCAHRAQTPKHYGRNPGRKFKRSHIEIAVQETPKQEKGKIQQKPKAEKEKKTVEVKK